MAQIKQITSTAITSHKRSRAEAEAPRKRVLLAPICHANKKLASLEPAKKKTKHNPELEAFTRKIATLNIPKKEHLAIKTMAIISAGKEISAEDREKYFKYQYGDTIIMQFYNIKRLFNQLPSQVLNDLKINKTFIDRTFIYVWDLFERKPNAQNITFTDMQLIQLPRNIGNLKELKDLNISLNDLTHLPSELGNCTNLEILNLSGNKLVMLPAALGNCTNLKTLNVMINDLINIPTELTKLSELDSFMIDWKSFEFMPSALKETTIAL